LQTFEQRSVGVNKIIEKEHTVISHDTSRFLSQPIRNDRERLWPSADMSGDALLCCTSQLAQWIAAIVAKLLNLLGGKKASGGNQSPSFTFVTWDGWGFYLLSPLQSWMRKLGAPT
jgi:hypothetical protein